MIDSREMKTLVAILSLLFASQTPTTCDRECLRGFLDRYLTALSAHKPEDVPEVPNLRFTEDTMEMKLGEGLWKTAGKLSPYRLDILDVRQGIAGTHTILEENGKRVMLVLRMKIEARKITEVETQVAMPQNTPSGWDAR